MNALVQNLRTLLKLLAVLAILIVLNLVVAQVDWSWDMTEAGIYSLSGQTKDIVSAIEEPTTIYFFHTDQGGGSRADPAMIRRMAKRYAGYSNNVTFREVNPNQNPGLTQEFQIRSNNTVVVEVGERTKTVGTFDMFDFPRSRRGKPMFRGEAAITEALVSLTQQTDRSIFFTKGHGELKRQPAQERSVSQWTNNLEKEGFTIKTFNPSFGDLPDTREMIAILGPSRPMGAPILKELRTWNRRGGHLLLATQPETARSFNPLLEGSGIELNGNQIIDPNRRVRSIQSLMNPFIFAPILNSHPTVNSIQEQGLGIQVGRSSSIETEGDTADVIMRTSEQAYAKPLFKEGQEEIEVAFNDRTDTRGSFNVATAVSGPGEKRSLLVIGNATLFGNRMYQQAPGNSNFARNVVNWMFERQVSLDIRATPLDYNQVTVTAQQAQFIEIISLIAIPGLIILWGGWVWWTRKNR